jgi:hypothetical protein
MRRKGEDRSGGPTAGGGAARDARLRAALRQNLLRRKARAHALVRPDAPPHDDAHATDPGGALASAARNDADSAPEAALRASGAPTDPAKDS